ncbi:MAG: rhamnulokinase [Firmicutes bacterium]|nr:rhamnulokinase [Bacillota bacterium]
MKMTAAGSYLAFDLGASGGRLMAGAFDGEKLSLREVHRFPNDPVKARGRFYWDALGLFREMTLGLRKAKSLGIRPKSVGIDTWGVDYALFDRDKSLVGPPVFYRDSRTDGMKDEVAGLMPLREIYDRTGIQFMDFNTIFQLRADMRFRPAVWESARKLLFMPDLFGFFLTGEMFNEYTIASTSQLLNAGERALDAEILKKLDIPRELFADMVLPGSIIGGVDREILSEAGFGADDVKFVAVGSHDTASAVAGTPFGRAGSGDTGGVFLSCGTWSLLGREADAPIINGDTYARNFTNEGGVNGKIRFLKNINGLWIIQKLRESKGGELGYGEIAQAARSARAGGQASGQANRQVNGQPDKRADFRIDPNAPAFMAPGDMEKAVADYCEEHGQGRPSGLGEIALAVYSGLTEEYRAQLESLEELTGRAAPVINMVGGGIRDEFLCELTASATRRKIVAGPVEASVLGNIAVQMAAVGDIAGMDEGREIIGRSFERKEYEPS